MNNAVVLSPDSSAVRRTCTFVVSIHTVLGEEDATAAHGARRRLGLRRMYRVTGTLHSRCVERRDATEGEIADAIADADMVTRACAEMANAVEGRVEGEGRLTK